MPIKSVCVLVMLTIICCYPTFSNANCKSNRYFFENGTIAEHSVNIQECTKEIALEPTNKEYKSNRADSFIVTGKYSNAIKEYTEMINKGEDYYYMRGFAYIKSGNKSKAVKDFKKHIELNKPEAKYVDKIDFLIKHGREMTDDEECSMVLPRLNKAIAKNPKDSKLYTDRAYRYAYGCDGNMQNIDSLKAVKDFETAIKLDPKSSEPSFNLAKFYNHKLISKNNDPDKAIKYYQQALDIGNFDKNDSDQNPHIIMEEIRLLQDGKTHPEKKILRESINKVIATWTLNETTNNKTIKYFINEDLYAVFSDKNDLNSLQEVKFPKYVSKKLNEISNKNGFTTSQEIPFYIWYNTDIANFTNPSFLMMLYYLNDLVVKNDFKTIDNIISIYFKYNK